MDRKTLEAYRQRLLDQQQEIVKRIFTLEEDLQALTNARDIERTDHVQAEVPEEVLQKLDEQGRHETEEIQAALARIEAGTYSCCETCGKSIRTARLDALPMARRCTPCQTRAEKE